MKKSDVEIRSSNHNCWVPPGVPSINIKWSPYLFGIYRKYRESGHEFSGNEDGFWTWLEILEDSDEWENSFYGGDDGIFTLADQITREMQWEQAVNDVEEIFEGYSIKVYQDGRSGGWLTVHNLPDVESWDAIMLGKWARAVKYVRQIVDDCDYQFIWYLHVNFFEPYIEGEIEFAEIRSKHPRSEWSQLACGLNTELGYEQWLRTLENA